MFPPHVYIVFVLVVSAAVACCFLAVFFYRRICKDEYEPCPCCTTLCCRCCHPSTPQDPIRMKIKCVSTATFTMYFVGAVLHGICNLLYLAGGNWFPFEILAFVAYISGLHFILIIFVYRLESFAGSALPGFAYLPKTIQRLRIGITILFCVIPLAIILVFTLPSDDDVQNITRAVMGFWLIFYVAMWITLAILYMRKIIPVLRHGLSLLKEHRQSNEDLSTFVIDLKPTTSLIRYTLLVLVGFLSSIANVGSRLLSPQWDLGWIEGVDGFINALCVCLLFRFSTPFYYKICCFDKCFTKCFMRSITSDPQFKDEPHHQQAASDFESLLMASRQQDADAERQLAMVSVAQSTTKPAQSVSKPEITATQTND
eukprot:49408_1